MRVETSSLEVTFHLSSNRNYPINTGSSPKMNIVEFIDTMLRCVCQKDASTGTTAFGTVPTSLNLMSRGILFHKIIKLAVKTAQVS